MGKQWPGTNRNNRCLVRPLLGAIAALVDKAIESVALIRPEPRPQHQVMRRHENIDKIKLQKSKRFNDAPEVPYVGLGIRAGTIESLSRESNSPRFCRRHLHASNQVEELRE